MLIGIISDTHIAIRTVSIHKNVIDVFKVVYLINNFGDIDVKDDI